MLTRRYALAAGLLLLAGAMSAPALIGPLLLPDPPIELITPRASRLSPPDETGAVAGTSGTRDVTRRTGIAPGTGGPGVTTPAPAPETSAFTAEDPGAPGGRFEGTMVAGRTFPYTEAPGGAYSSGSSRSRITPGDSSFGGGSSYTGSTPGLLGWGLSDRGGSAAGVEMPVAAGSTSRLTNVPAGGGTTPATATGSGASPGVSSGGSSGSSSDDSGGSSSDSGSTSGSTGDTAGTSSGFSTGAGAPPPPPPGGDSGTGGDDGGVLSGLGITPDDDGSGDEGSSLAPDGGGSMPAPNPEPGTLLLVGGGAALAGLYRRARARRQSR